MFGSGLYMFRLVVVVGLVVVVVAVVEAVVRDVVVV
jgi:hypothetical protein